jgi:hypothetical protein
MEQCRRSRVSGWSLEVEAHPRVVQQRGAAELDISPRRNVLRVAALHPEDMFRNAGLDGSGEASSAGADAGEQGRVEARRPGAARPRSS